MPSTTKIKGETRSLNERRPRYLTPDGHRVPGRIYGTTPGGGFIIATADYERVRDLLYAHWGPVEVVHDDLVWPPDERCWAACRGADTLWVECSCPCLGSNHGDGEGLLNYTLESTRLIGTISRLKRDSMLGVVEVTYPVQRRAFTYRQPAVSGPGGHLRAV